MVFFARVLSFSILILGQLATAQDIIRFPPPDFEEGYVLPQTQTPAAKSDLWHAIDVVVLVAALSTASYLVIKKRSREGVFKLTIFSIVYFGFIREGCICPIGAIQNVTLALADNTYALPKTALAFFLLPLFFTLFFGRVFCAGVCPLGAIQDLVLIRPIRVPLWLHHALSFLPYLYFGAAVMFTALGGAFIICKYDPFISFFRLTGGLNVVLLGTSLLVIGLFVGRPYCLYLCPYSVLLKLFSRFSQWRVLVGPEGECTQCELCEDACPFNAINPATAEDMPHPNRQDRKRLAVLLLVAPILIVMGGWVFSFAAAPISQMHFTVRLAERIVLEDAGLVEGYTDASEAFRNSGAPKETLLERAHGIRQDYSWGSWILGGFIGLVIACKLIDQSIFRKREIHEADRAGCLACGRCYCSCPLELKRLRQLKSASFV